MKKILPAAAALAIVLFSCQKEPSTEDPGNGGGGGSSNGDLLVKMVSKTGSETLTTTFTYDANKKIINHKITGRQNGVDITDEYRFYRNSSGIIIRMVQVPPVVAGAGIDSVVSIVHHDGTKYTSYVSEIGALGFSVLDSVAISYNGSGKPIRTDQFQSMPFSGGYTASGKDEYIYQGDNLVQTDMYTYNAATLGFDLDGTSKSTFDNKAASLNLGAEGILFNADAISANNIIKTDVNYIGVPVPNLLTTITYTYNASNRPSTAVATVAGPANMVQNITYYYQ
jgi:hypothetical protein